jgi:uncharacterized membrane protein YeaQ/YmgE (transglycosylase-associated protein family)
MVLPDSRLFCVYNGSVTLLEFLVLLAVAAICGSVGQAIAGYSHIGCFASIALGFVGAVLGSWLARYLGLSEFFAVKIGSVNFPVVWSIIGATIFVAIVGLLRRTRA